MKIITYSEAVVLSKEIINEMLVEAPDIKSVAKSLDVVYSTLFRFLSPKDKAMFPDVAAQILSKKYLVKHYKKTLLDIELGDKPLPKIFELVPNEVGIVTLTEEKAQELAWKIFNYLRIDFSVAEISTAQNININSLRTFPAFHKTQLMLGVTSKLIGAYCKVLAIEKTYFYEISEL